MAPEGDAPVPADTGHEALPAGCAGHGLFDTGPKAIQHSPVGNKLVVSGLQLNTSRMVPSAQVVMRAPAILIPSPATAPATPRTVRHHHGQQCQLGDLAIRNLPEIGKRHIHSEFCKLGMAEWDSVSKLFQ